jgi:hypothetical protein
LVAVNPVQFSLKDSEMILLTFMESIQNKFMDIKFLLFEFKEENTPTGHIAFYSISESSILRSFPELDIKNGLCHNLGDN